jgi:Family of unknown function (DUF6055)
MKTARITMAVACLLVLLISSANAFDLPATLGRIDSYAMATGIDQGQLALYKTYALFDPDRLPNHLRIERTSDPEHWFCATLLIIEIRELALNGSPEIRAEISRYVSLKPFDKFNAPSPTKAGLTENPDAYNTSNSLKTEHFNILWGSDSSVSQSEIDLWAEVLEEVWTIEVDTWGYDPVYLTDQYYLDIYLGNSGDDAPTISDAGGYTSLYDGTGQPFFVIHPAYMGHRDGLTDVCSHEFFHTLQFTVSITHDGCENYMSGMTNSWAIEGTATWAEEEAYPDLNSYTYAISFYAENPHHRLDYINGYENYNEAYSRVIWWIYMDEFFGGRQIIHDLWNDGCYSSIFDANVNALASQGETVASVFPDFAKRIFFLDFPEGDLYPSFDRVAVVSEYPKDLSPGEMKPQLLGMNFIELWTPTQEQQGPLTITFDGDSKLHSREFEWNVQVMAMTEDQTFVDLDLEIKNGQGVLEVPEFCDEYGRIYLILIPFDEAPDHADAANYTLSVKTPYVPIEQDEKCETALTRIYNQCGLSLGDFDSFFGASEAYEICGAGGNSWDCVYGCATDDPDASCSDLATCVENCGFSVGQPSSDDEDDEGVCCG